MSHSQDTLPTKNPETFLGKLPFIWRLSKKQAALLYLKPSQVESLPSDLIGELIGKSFDTRKLDTLFRLAIMLPYEKVYIISTNIESDWGITLENISDSITNGKIVWETTYHSMKQLY